MKKMLLVLVIMAISYSLAVADWSDTTNHKMHWPQLPDTLGWDVNATQPVILADDFMCTETGFIKDIHFWGSWRNGVEGTVTQFVLSIHSDIPVSDTILYSRPGQTLWEHEISDFLVQPFDPPTMEGWYDPTVGEVIPNSIGNYFQYNVFLPDSLWFPQDSGTIYWLNISAIVQDPVTTRWGWKSTNDHWNDDAVWALWGDLTWYEMYEPNAGYPYMPGDVNGDDTVTQADVDYLQAYLQGGLVPFYAIPGTNPPFYAACDVNGSCSVTGSDVTHLQSFINTGAPPLTFCPTYPPGGPPVSLDLAFVITNGQPQEDIPTLNEWGMLILALLLLGAGTIAVIRRRKTVSART